MYYLYDKNSLNAQVVKYNRARLLAYFDAFYTNDQFRNTIFFADFLSKTLLRVRTLRQVYNINNNSDGSANGAYINGVSFNGTYANNIKADSGNENGGNENGGNEKKIVTNNKYISNENGVADTETD